MSTVHTTIVSPGRPTLTPEVEPLPQLLSDAFLRDPKFLLAVIVGSGVILLYYLFGSSKTAAAGKGKQRGVPKILLLGSSDAGKTAIFSKLVYNHPSQTHTSLTPSQTTISLPSLDGGKPKPVQLSDIPGHPRLKETVREQLGSADAVVFVVDVGTLIRNGAQVVEELPPILTQLASNSLTSPSSTLPRILLLAHKADLLSHGSSTVLAGPGSPSTIDDKTRTLAVERMKMIVTREMERLKASRGSTSGRIESISSIASAGSAPSLLNLFGLLSFNKRQSSGPVVLSEEGLEEAESMIWGQVGKFKWEEVDGVEVEWGVSGLAELQVGQKGVGSAKAEVGEGDDGLNEVREWLYNV